MNIAIILPAYNEELTLADTIRDFHSVMPEAGIWVVDNASTDRTSEIARETFACLEKETPGETERKGNFHLLYEGRKGKASAIRKAFMEIDADIYVMVDADTTYPAKDLPALMRPVVEKQADLVCGNRHASGKYSEENKRPLHNIGNKFVRWTINKLFNGNLKDILTGYRVMSRRFVKNYPILSSGFALETEMSIHALDMGYTVIDLPTDYRDRPAGSFSKLDTLQDGILVLKTITSIFIRYKPLVFFTTIAAVTALACFAAGAVPVVEYAKTGKILRFPLAILATGLGITALLSFAIGIILNAIAVQQRFIHALTRLKDN